MFLNHWFGTNYQQLFTNFKNIPFLIFFILKTFYTKFDTYVVHNRWFTYGIFLSGYYKLYRDNLSSAFLKLIIYKFVPKLLEKFLIIYVLNDIL